MGFRRVLEDFYAKKDDGTACTDAVVSSYLAGTTTPTTMYADKDGTSSLGSSEGFLTTGYPPDLWVSDQESVKLVVTGTGMTTLTRDYYAIADSSATDSGDSASEFKNFLSNPGFAAWTAGTSFANISGSGTGVETADGWYFSQSTAASNAVSRQTAVKTGARYGLRFGRPAGSTSTNQLRLWETILTDDAYRLAGQTVTVSFSVQAGANFSAASSQLSVILATGTSEGQSGDLIASSGWGGHVNAVNQNQIISTTQTRYQFTATLNTGIKEVGIQLAYTPSGTAGANDWVQIEDVQIEIASSATDMHAAPEPVDFVRGKMSAFGRTLIDDADAAAARSTLGLVIGTNVQAYDADLTTWAGITPSASAVSGLPLVTAAGAALWDDADAAAQRTTLGLGTAATVADSSLVHISGTETISGAKTFSALTTVSNTLNVNAGGATTGTISLGTGGNTIITAASGALLTINSAGYSTVNILGALQSAGNTVYHAGNLPGTAVTWTANQRINVANSAIAFLVNGGTRGVRFNVDGTRMALEGVDQTGTGSYQDLGIGGATVTFLISGSSVGGINSSGALQIATQVSSETSGTLTSASRNKIVKASGGITINDGVFTADDQILIYAGSSSRTITQDTGMTLRLDGTATTGNRTIAAYGKMHVYFNSNSEAICSGQGVS